MRRILVVDQKEIVRDGLRYAIGAALPEAFIGEAGTPEEALAQLAGPAWDAVVLDLNLQGRGGLDLITECRRLRPRLPLLVLSAYPEEEFGLRCLQLGADGFIEKSCRSAEIVAALRKVMDGGKYVSASLAERLAGAAGRSLGKAAPELLTPRELQVLRLVAAGRTLKEIARELHLGERTVATHRARLREKLGLSTNVEITRYALRHGLVE